jgi:flagellar protein FliO/FliZ
VKTLVLTLVFLFGLITQANTTDNPADSVKVQKHKELESVTEEIKKSSDKDVVGREVGLNQVGGKETLGKDFNSKELSTKELNTKELGIKELSTKELSPREANGKESEQKELNTKDVSVKSDFDETQINYKGADEESTPILTKSKNKVEEQSGTIYRTLSIVFVLFIAGGVGLWYLKKKSQMGDNKQTLTQIKVLTQYHLAPRKTLTVIRVAGESLLIGVTENQITLLKSLSLLDEDIPDSTPKSFKQTIAESSAEASVDAPPKNTVLKSVEFTDSDEEFSFGNIKHLVENKLKGMKRW